MSIFATGMVYNHHLDTTKIPESFWRWIGCRYRSNLDIWPWVLKFLRLIGVIPWAKPSVPIVFKLTFSRIISRYCISNIGFTPCSKLHLWLDCSVENVPFPSYKSIGCMIILLKEFYGNRAFLSQLKSYIIDFTTLQFKLCFIYLASNAKCIYVLVHNIKNI
jgi:hypothetical protein